MSINDLFKEWYVVQCRRKNESDWWLIGGDFKSAQDARDFVRNQRARDLKRATFRVLRCETTAAVWDAMP